MRITLSILSFSLGLNLIGREKAVEPLKMKAYVKERIGMLLNGVQGIITV